MKAPLQTGAHHSYLHLNATSVPGIFRMTLTVVFFVIALAIIASAVLSGFDPTSNPTHQTPQAVTGAQATGPDRCRSTNGQLRSCDEDELGSSTLK